MVPSHQQPLQDWTPASLSNCCTVHWRVASSAWALRVPGRPPCWRLPGAPTTHVLHGCRCWSGTMRPPTPKGWHPGARWRDREWLCEGRCWELPTPCHLGIHILGGNWAFLIRLLTTSRQRSHFWPNGPGVSECFRSSATMVPWIWRSQICYWPYSRSGLNPVSSWVAATAARSVRRPKVPPRWMPFVLLTGAVCPRAAVAAGRAAGCCGNGAVATAPSGGGTSLRGAAPSTHSTPGCVSGIRSRPGKASGWIPILWRSAAGQMPCTCRNAFRRYPSSSISGHLWCWWWGRMWWWATRPL